MTEKEDLHKRIKPMLLNFPDDSKERNAVQDVEETKKCKIESVSLRDLQALVAWENQSEYLFLKKIKERMQFTIPRCSCCNKRIK